MKNGIYALASLNGAPLDRGKTGPLFSGLSVQIGDDAEFVAVAMDIGPSAASRHDRHDGADVFLGHLDDADAMARRLGLAGPVSAAELAGAAHDRWGPEAARRLAGEWTLLRWDNQARTLVLLTSECLRDDCYFAVSGGRVAIAPELVRLARLDGIDGSLDPDALLRAMGRYAPEYSLSDRTFVRGVHRLLPGTQVTIGQDGSRTATLPSPDAPTLARLSFDEAVHEVEVLLRRTVRRRLSDGRDAAFMLSGGLDSSLLVWIASEERRPGQSLHLLSSAAPAGSGIPDEVEWAALVANHLGLPLIPVTPAPDADPYAPTERMLAGREGPLMSPRHYLYEALEEAALREGASTLFDGVYGELTVSNPGTGIAAAIPWRRRLARRLRSDLTSLGRARGVTSAPSHVRLSARLLKVAEGLSTTGREVRPQSGSEAGPFGYAAGWDKSAWSPTVIGDPAVRYVMPFRHPELLARFASLPAEFANHRGVPRAIGRAILRDRLPDRIVSRTTKMPFSPTYPLLLASHAETARERLAAQRAAGADEWLDLDWLDRALDELAGEGATPTTELFRIQATAMAAEFFRWWRDQTVRRW